ncbi:jg23513 [Pararge aegeria aegeria]|uniref:Jg23513 protein n=1 Tax=Pararge aegeria aegeria TaxID=348720 RepID=A0A8S4QMZ9_9NEOP|nr:jg23513 [Pararge aegeria aegeria]
MEINKTYNAWQTSVWSPPTGLAWWSSPSHYGRPQSRLLYMNAQERQPLEKSGEVLSSEPQNPDDDHDQSVKTETTKKKIMGGDPCSVVGR